MTANLDPVRRNARVAGLLYLLLVLVAPLRLVVVPSLLFVSGHPGETAARIAAQEGLFQLGIAGDLFCGALEVFLTLALYRLFREVDGTLAVLMAGLGMWVTPFFFLNAINDAAVLFLARGGDFLSAFSRPQLDALLGLFLHLHGFEITADEIFWGLWLFPLALLVLRSRIVPRFIGYWLILNGIAYIAESVSGLLLPQWEDTITRFAVPAQLAEIAFVVALLIVGFRRGARLSLTAA